MRAPGHEELVEDLRRLRERGLTAIRGLGLPHLSAAAWLAGETVDEKPTPAVIEGLLRAAVVALGGGDLQQATEYTFGVRPGMRGTPAVIRRRRAAEVYGVTPERFRKAQERIIISQLADAILERCRQDQAGKDKAQALEARHPRDVTQAGGVPGRWVKVLSGGHREHMITLHVKPVETLTDIDIIVSSENVYFEGSQIFKPSLSAALRLACATRDTIGGILDDVIARELAGWTEKNGRRGLPMAIGTVAATSPGYLARQNIRRIYHAAIVNPMPGTDNYIVPPEAIPDAVRNVMLLARKERESARPPFKSICFPLFGSGSGGLTQQESLSWIWDSIRRELIDDEWEIHLLTRELTDMKLNGWEFIDGFSRDFQDTAPVNPRIPDPGSDQ